MDLREYLFRKQISITEFSNQLECSRGYLSTIVHGKKPSRLLAKEIERITNGEVTVEELMKTAPKNEEVKPKKEDKPNSKTTPKGFSLEGSIFDE